MPHNKNYGKIVVTHVNIRQSIYLLLLKLISVDVFGALLVIGFFSSLFLPFSTELKIKIISNNGIYFFMLVLFKIGITLFLILQWLNEYYEITPQKIIHRKGIIWTKEETFKIEHIESVSLKQGLIAKILNYGTIEFYDWRTKDNIPIYLIHNPIKYMNILESLVPGADEERESIREHIIMKSEEKL
ncbi:MAG: PH domain-containing protein [Candidatus Levybacteria bacterium]|nr:PH domain-containing protein [Candidatus Levybacteria bacterium]